jgi:ferredoxin
MSYVPSIDASACSAHGDCAAVAPHVFRVDAEVAEVIGTGTPEEVLEAAEACPAAAIVVVDSDTGEQVYP